MSQVYIIVSGVSIQDWSSRHDESIAKSTDVLCQKVISMFQRLRCFAITKDRVHILVNTGEVFEVTATGSGCFVLVSVLFLKSEEDQNWDILSIVDHRELTVIIKDWLKSLVLKAGSFWIEPSTRVLFRFEQTDHVPELLAGHTLTNPATWFSVV